MVTLNTRSENQFFAANLSLNLFRATVANADIGSLKFLHTLFDTYLDCMLVNFEETRIVQTTRNLTFLTKKKKQDFLKPFLTKN